MSRKRIVFWSLALALLLVGSWASAQQPPMAKKLIVYGDIAWFAGQAEPLNCILKSRYQRGEAVGFRITVMDPMTGKYVESAQAVIHLSYGGKKEDIPMRYRGTGNNPRLGFWTGKWVVPDDAPVGIVRYTITAVDADGRTGTFEPFQVEPSMLTVVK